VKIYTHLGMGDMRSVYESMQVDVLAERARAAVESGYRALKAVFIPYTHYTASPKDIDHAARMMESLRAAVGPDTEILVDFHRRPASVGGAAPHFAISTPRRLSGAPGAHPPPQQSGPRR
jgi:galactonate dehydratase